MAERVSKVVPWTVEQSLTMRVNTTLMGEVFDNVGTTPLVLPPPLWGRVGVGGQEVAEHLRDPHPRSLPHKGEGRRNAASTFASQGSRMKAVS